MSLYSSYKPQNVAGVSSVIAGTDTAVSTATGSILIWNTGTLQTVTTRGSTTSNAISITNTATSTSSTTGALTVIGGVGIGGNLYVDGQSYVNNSLVITTSTINNYSVTALLAGTDTAISTSLGVVTVWNTSTLQTITNRGSTTSNAISITNTATSTSSTTGALTVAGGVGTAGDLYVGGNSYIQKTNITATSDSVAAWIYDTTSTYTSTVTNQDIFFKPDGNKMFGVSTNAVYQWTLGTPWSLTSITTGTVYSLASVDTGVSGLTFSPDGTKMVVTGNTAVANGTFNIVAGEDRAYYFTLSSPWDPSTATLAGSVKFASGLNGYVGTSEATPTACAYDNTGSNFYMIGTTVRRVFQYSLSTPYVVSTSTAAYVNGIVLSEDTSPQGLSFNYTGTRMYILGATADCVYEYRLSTPWDVSTAVYYDKFFIGIQNGSMLGLYTNNTATNNAFMVGSVGVYRYITNTQAAYINPETTASNIILGGMVRVKGATNILYTDYDIFAGRNLVTYNNTVNVGQSGGAGAIFTGMSSGSLSFYTGQSSGALSVGGTVATGALTIGQSTAAQTLNLATGVTTSGTTKTVNIGTAGTTGSITNINIGPVLGTGTIIVGGSLTASKISVSGAYSSIDWGNTGTGLVVIASTYTNLTSSGTVASSSINSFGIPTIVSTTATTITSAATLYIAGVPLAGTNTTITNAYSLRVGGGTAGFGGQVQVQSLLIQNTAGILVQSGVTTIPIANTNATTINFAGSATTITVGATTGTTTFNSTTTSVSTTTGAVVIGGGVGIQGNLYAGNMYSNGSQVITTATLSSVGVSSIIAGADISVSSAIGNVTVSGISTLQSVTNRGSTTTNIVYINNTSTSNATTSGALIVSGGVGITGAANIGSTIAAVTQISVKSNSLDSANSSTFVISSTVPVGYSAFTIQNTGASGQSYTFDVGGNNRALTGGTSINEGNFTLKDDTNNAYRMVVTKTGSILVNTTTDTGGQLQVNGSISIKSSLLETTVTLVNNTSATVVDSFVSSVYRSCKSLVQIQDGTDFEITEIVLLHDDSGQVYKSEYGIISTSGEKGTFTADLQGDGIVRLYFTANSSSSKKISIVKTALAV